MLNQLGITRGDVVRYTLLPQILPRIKRLLTNPFYNLPYFIVVVFNTLGIIPNGHPYLLAANHGKYSLFKALSLAASYIKFDSKNIDKITIFAVILGGVAMLFLQMVLLVMALFTLPAYAYSGPGTGPTSISGFFGNPNTEHDIAFRLLDLIFGIPGIFNSGDMQTTPFHAGMHALFGFYSYGILLVGVFVIIYLVTRIVLETAQSGIPFGERFNHAWVPVRLVLFFALLIPTSNGINLAQYILLNAAKLGSNVATNAWLTFDKATKQAYLSPEQMISSPTAPDIHDLATFMAITRTCSWAEGRINGRDIRPYFVFGPGADGSIDISENIPALTDMVEKAKGNTLVFRYGEKDAEAYKPQQGVVFPYCGEVTMSLVDFGQPGAASMQMAYVEMLQCFWSGNSGSVFECPIPSFEKEGRIYTERYSQILPQTPFPNNPSITVYANDRVKLQMIGLLEESLDDAVKKSVETQIAEGAWTNDPASQLGWAGAGIWFNKIAEMNGAITGAVMARPYVQTMPYVMEYIKKQKLAEDSQVPVMDMYKPFLSSGKSITYEVPQDRQIALVLNQVYSNWGSDDNTQKFSTDIREDEAPVKKPEATGNVILDTMNWVMGTRGLFDMCANAKTHPLAQLSAVGKGLIDHSIGAFATATGLGLTAGIVAFMDKQGFAPALMAGTKFLLTFAGIGLVAGFVLYYVIPFLPFVYFFFAIMTWAKGIFEAMVGMPLWALAHLRIGGDGMPGDLAASGYFYIFEVFLRPVAILIGFLGGILIFGALVKVLNEIFYLVLANLTGHHAVGTAGCFTPPAGSAAVAAPGQDMAIKRGVIDQFFYTVIYAIIVFLISGPCFKLVDLIPDHITRWMALGIESFGSRDGDPADNLTRNITVGAGAMGDKLRQGFAGIEEGVGKGLQEAKARAAKDAEQ